MNISLSSDALDFDWHPRKDVELCAVALISGKVQLIDYHGMDDAVREGHSTPHTAGGYKKVHTVRPSKKSARALCFDQQGSSLWSASKDGSLSRIDTATGSVSMQYQAAHEGAPSRLLSLAPNLLASGDDDGVVRLWDPRRPAVPSTNISGSDASASTSAVRSYHHHFDWITELLWFEHLEAPKTKSRDALREEEKRKKALKKRKKGKERVSDGRSEHRRAESDSDSDSDAREDIHKAATLTEGRSRLVCASGDGTLSVIDVRAGGQSSKVPATAVEVSEDQEDELLSIAAIKGGNKLVVGTQQGMLSLWAPSRGLFDHVDRIPGHPSSVDALCSLDADTVLTGSADGLVRAVQVLPHKFLGVVADHDGMPVERIRRKDRWVASLGHTSRVLITDVQSLLEDDDDSEEDEVNKDEGAAKKGGKAAPSSLGFKEQSSDGDSESDVGGHSAAPASKKARLVQSNAHSRDTDGFFAQL